MKTIRSLQRNIIIGSLVTAGLAINASGAGEWSLSAGPMIHWNMNMEANGSSYAQENGLHGASAYNDIQSARDYRNRTYDNGFVNTDPGTADPASIVPGLTWNWGYSHDDQYDAANNRLSFQSRGSSVSVTPDRNLSVDEDKDTTAFGIEVMGRRSLGQVSGCDLSLDIGLQILRADGQSLDARPYSEQITRSGWLVSDTYNTAGAALPAAPYAGTYEGPGSVIPNVPESRTARATSTSRSVAENQVNLNVDSSIFSLVLGPMPFGNSL